jgi:hypothetical protein
VSGRSWLNAWRAARPTCNRPPGIVVNTRMLKGQRQGDDVTTEAESLVSVVETNLPVGCLSKDLCHRGSGVCVDLLNLTARQHFACSPSES